MGFVLGKRLDTLLIAMPLMLAAIASALILLGDSPLATTALLAGWGFVSTAAPVGWWTWLSRALPDDAEAGGGLMVAVIQLAITVGAGVGGLLVDASGYPAAFAASAASLCGSALLAGSTRARVPVRRLTGGVVPHEHFVVGSSRKAPPVA